MKSITIILTALIFSTLNATSIDVALDFLKEHEGIVLSENKSEAVVYDDAKPSHKWDGKTNLQDFIKSCKGTPTIGYGETDKDIVNLGIISLEKAEDLLKKRVESLAEYIDEKVAVSLSDNETAALISFTYNVGRGAFADSTLLKKLNNNEKEEVSAQLMRWVYSNGKKNNGLINRRKDEVELWQK